MKKSSITSLMSAFGRVYHAENADTPIFDDRKARELITDEEYSMIANYILGGIDFLHRTKRIVLQTTKKHSAIWSIHKLHQHLLPVQHFVRLR